MDSWLLPALVATLATSLVLAVATLSLYVRERRVYLLEWSIAWIAYSLRFAAEIGYAYPIGAREPWLVAVALLTVASAGLLLTGSLRFVGVRLVAWHRWAIGVAGASAGLWAVVATLSGGAPEVVVSLPFALIGAAYLVSGWAWLRSRKVRPSVWSAVVGWSFVLWGLHKWDYAVLRFVEWFAPWGYLFASVLAMVVALGILLDHMEVVREELASSEARYRRLFLENSQPQLLVDPEDGSIIDASDAAVRFYGWSRSELTRMRVQDINQLSEPEVEAEMRLARAQERDHFEFRHAVASGRIRDVEVYTGPIRIEGKEYLLSTIHDISARRRSEREVREHRGRLEELVARRTEELARVADELRLANRAKDDFLAAMSHELRTPLNAVIGFSGMLHDGMAGELTEEQRRQVGMIRESGRRLLALVDQILDLAKEEHGRGDVSYDEADLCESVREVAELMRPMVDAAALSLETECPGHPVRVITGDEKVRQIVMNLLSNAIKFTESGWVRIALEESEADVRIRVEDSGPGIASEEIPLLFEDFSRLGRTAKDSSSGIGLGLAISRRLARLLGGDIQVESAVGRGSTFTLVLPKEPPPASPSAKPSPDPSANPSPDPPSESPADG